MSSPPRKRLKQTSIEDCFFKRKTSLSKTTQEKSVDDQHDQEVNMATINRNVTSEQERQLRLDAAERRFKNGTPDKTPPREEEESLPVNKEDDQNAEDKHDKKESPESECSATLELDGSQDLFSDSDFGNGNQSSSQQSDNFCEKINEPDTSQLDDSGPSKGMPKTELKNHPSCSLPLTDLQPSSCQTVLYNCKFSPNSNRPPEPYPHTYRDKWGSDHVHLPCSEKNEYPVTSKFGHKEIAKRWNMIHKALNQTMRTSADIERAILSYNTRHEGRWDFSSLHDLFRTGLTEEETEMFFSRVLPRMALLAAKLPHLCTQGIPLLKQNNPHTIHMSQEQAACLLANAFFCTFPRRNTRQKQSEYSTYPDINFNQLFQGSKHSKNPRKIEKLKCILQYFRRVTSKMPTGTLSFSRQRLGRFPNWKTSSTQLCGLHVTSHGTIEDDGIGMLQVDFANKFIGGGVLGHGCVQEEIRFMICPEMILSRLFTEVLEKDECLIMTGCERFSNYRGYADSFEWMGNHEDPTPRDSWGRLHTEVVAIDASVYRGHSNGQFRDFAVTRELNKAYCGFLTPGVSSEHLSAIATGNWGCGAFGGDHMLKALIQLMAAAETQRDVCYFTFGNRNLRDSLHSIHSLIQKRELAVSDLWTFIQEYNKKYCSTPWEPKTNLFKFIEKTCQGNISDSDAESASTCESHEAASRWEDEPDWAASTP